MDVEAAKAAFEALSIDDRLKATRFAKLYAAEIKAQNRSYPLSAVNWLRKRKFYEAERIASAKGQEVALKAMPVFVAKGTDAWYKWVSHFMKTKGKPPPVVPHGDRTGWWFPSLFPPRLETNSGPRPPETSGGKAFEKVGF